MLKKRFYEADGLACCKTFSVYFTHNLSASKKDTDGKALTMSTECNTEKLSHY